MSKNDIREFIAFDPKRIKAMHRDTVLVKRQPIEWKVGSIHIPETSRYVDRSDYADVIAIGSDVKGYAVGDVVLLPDVLDVKAKFTHEGETYSIVHKDFIMAVAE